jgi:hypothetical protein
MADASMFLLAAASSASNVTLPLRSCHWNDAFPLQISARNGASITEIEASRADAESQQEAGLHLVAKACHNVGRHLAKRDRLWLVTSQQCAIRLIREHLHVSERMLSAHMRARWQLQGKHVLCICSRKSSLQCDEWLSGTLGDEYD